MKLNIKPFRSFVNESEDQEQELRDMGFQDRQELSSPEEIDDVLYDFFFHDQEIADAWRAFNTKLREKLAKFKKEYTWKPDELSELADYYLENSRDYTSDGLHPMIAGGLMDIVDEGDL